MYKAIIKLENNLYLYWRLLSWRCSFFKIRHVPKPNMTNLFPSYNRDGVFSCCYIGRCWLQLYTPSVRMLPAGRQSNVHLLRETIWRMRIPTDKGGNHHLWQPGQATTNKLEDCSSSGFSSFVWNFVMKKIISKSLPEQKFYGQKVLGNSQTLPFLCLIF